MNPVTTFLAHESYVLNVIYSRDGKTLISSGMDGRIRLWNTQTWELLHDLAAHSHSVNSLSLSGDGHWLASGSTDATVKIWSFPELELRCTLTDRKKTCPIVKISPNGSYVAAGYYAGRAALWAMDGTLQLAFQANRRNLAALSFSPDGQVLASGGLGEMISLWRLPGGKPLGHIPGHAEAVMHLQFLEDGKSLLSLDYAGNLRWWRAGNWTVMRVEEAIRRVRGIAFSPGEAVAALSVAGGVELRLVKDWALWGELPAYTPVVNGMDFSPDGKRIAFGSADRKLHIWEL